MYTYRDFKNAHVEQNLDIGWLSGQTGDFRLNKIVKLDTMP